MALGRRALLAQAGGVALFPRLALGLDQGRLASALQLAQDNGAGSARVLLNGRLAASAGDQSTRYDLKSLTKSIGSLVLGMAIGDGRVSLNARAASYLADFGVPPPENRPLAGRVTLLQLATHTAGFEESRGYGRIVFPPGSAFSYSNGGPNWLADVLTASYGQDLALLFRRRTGIALSWRANASRPRTIAGVPSREFGSGVVASVESLARVGQLALAGGAGIPATYVAQMGRTPGSVRGLPVRSTRTTPGDASGHYGLLWWNNNDGQIPGVPGDAFWGWGLGDSLLLVVRSLRLVVARAGQPWRRGWTADYRVVAPFFQQVVAAVRA